MKQILSPISKDFISFFTYLCDTSGVGHIRTILPSLTLNSLSYHNKKIFSFYGNLFNRDQNWYREKLFIKYQRSADYNQLMMIKHVKENIQPLTSFKTIYDIDDHLFAIEKTNYAYKYYAVNKPYIEEILKIVDGITVSTPFLKKIMGEYNKNVEIVPNYLLKCFWDFPKKEIEHTKPRILYAGSFNHFANDNTDEKTGGDFSLDLIDFIKKSCNEIEWVFVGGHPKELLDEINNKKIEYYNWLNILQYPKFLYNLNCNLAIAPLEINDFNRAKSDLKVLEYTALNLPSIFTKIDPYIKSSCNVNNDEFVDTIQKIIGNTDLQKEILDNNKKILEKRFFEDNWKYWLNQHLKICGKKLI